MKITPVILSGGSGTRLWPLSRPTKPKQFLKLIDNQSLFQKTILRVSNSKTFNQPIIVCNQEHRFMAAEELQNLSIKSGAVILEPISKNTAPAIAVAALETFSQNNKDNDLMLVMPSDHLISNNKKFITAVKSAINLANQGYLVTFGILPTKAETGYGYIKKGKKLDNNLFEVDKFIEKPNKSKAQKLILNTNYLWNGGIFLFKASIYLHNLRKANNDIFINSANAYNKATKDLDFIRIDAEEFSKCENISIDYAVMEKVNNIAVCPIDVGWNDIGNWASIAEVEKKDENGNSLMGDIEVIDTKNCYIKSKNGLVTTVGVKDLIIISLEDAILIANKNNAGDVKKLYEILQKKHREECFTHRKVYRPWGSFETIDIDKGFKVKKIIVKPGASLSLQMHNHRAEHWIIVKGTALVTCDDKQITLTEDQSTYIPITKKHRLENKGKVNLEVIEVQTGDYLGEDDIVRFSDIYGR